jgi:hypothetical protein
VQFVVADRLLAYYCCPAAGCRAEPSYSGSSTGAAAAAALLAAAAAGPQPEPWTKLAGIAEALAVLEAAISQNIYLPQLLQYRWAVVYSW